jgi:hypothetical protein
MSVNDIQVIKDAGPVRKIFVASGAVASISAGEPIKKSTNAAILCATGDPEVGTDEMLGIASASSTETAAADGNVTYWSLLPGQTTLRGKATTAANVDTAAELAGLIGDWVAFDLTGAVFTIDEDETDDPNVHGLKIIDGDIVRGTLDVLVHSMATEAGTTI